MVDLVKTSMARIWANQGDIVSPTDEKIEEGWGVEPVPRQWWNWMQNRVDSNIAYLLQKGIPEWDNTTEYIVNKSYVQRQDVVFKCIKTNTGKDPLSNADSWVKAFASASAALEAIGKLTPAPDTFPYFTGANVAALTALTPLARTFLAASTTAQMRSAISAQTESAILTALANVPTGINALPYFTGQAQANTTILTAYARSLLDDDSASAARSTLGLGSMAVQDSTAVNITGGSISGIAPLPVLSGGTGAGTVSGARSNLGLGTAAIVDTTTGSMDDNTSRVMKVGDFGIGRKFTSQVFDFNQIADTLPATGFYPYMSNVGSTNGPTSGSYFYLFQLVYSTSGNVTQIAYPYRDNVDGGIWTRSRFNGIWTSWVQNLTTASLSAFMNSLIAINDATAFRVAIGADNASNLTSGAVPVARGGTGATANTGTGRNVLHTSPEFIGTPTAPTAPSGTKTTQLATTAFVIDNASANPIGTVIQSASDTVPSGYLKCNGANVSRTTYAALFNVIGTRYGVGDGSTTFTLPDLRGEFIRGWDDGRGVDAGRGLGSWQDGQNESHTHGAYTNSAGSHTHTGSTNSAGNHTHSIDYGRGEEDQRNTGNPGGYYRGYNDQTGAAGAHTHSLDINSNGAHTHSVVVNASGGNESRPRNVALMFLIKF